MNSVDDGMVGVSSLFSEAGSLNHCSLEISVPDFEKRIGNPIMLACPRYATDKTITVHDVWKFRNKASERCYLYRSLSV